MIVAGSFLSYFVIVPIFAHLGQFMSLPINPGDPPLGCQTAADIFDNYARKIGIGAIFAAGIISIIRMLPIIGQAFGKAFSEMFKKRSAADQGSQKRIDRDIPMKTVVLMMLGIAVVLWLYLRFSVLADVAHPTALSTVAVAMMYLVSFLFAAVSAWAVAMISVTPISGMTLTTLLFSALILTRLGLKGDLGMLAMLLIGGVVCTALSMTGSLVTQFHPSPPLLKGLLYAGKPSSTHTTSLAVKVTGHHLPRLGVVSISAMSAVGMELVFPSSSSITANAPS
jgi:uncharacterized oligopeptide transporter (OPT) family protein